MHSTPPVVGPQPPQKILDLSVLVVGTDPLSVLESTHDSIAVVFTRARLHVCTLVV